MSAVGSFRLGYGAYLAGILSESSGENIVNWMRATLIVLLLIPVLAAHFYSVGQNFLDYLFAIMSVCLLIVALSEMLSRLPAGFLRTFIGIIALSLFSFYFYAQFLSYYFQGTYFNQNFVFHLNTYSITETWAAYSMLSVLFLLWFLALGLGFLFFRNKLAPAKYNSGVVVAIFFTAILLDPGIRRSLISGFGSPDLGADFSLEQVNWELLSLDQNALYASNLSATAGKNLVLIFMEGLEKIYTEESIFPGLTPNLNRLNGEGWQLENHVQVSGSEWTMGGMVSMMCGTPLVYESSLGGNDIMFTRLLSRAHCLPDVLNRANYQQVFMGGASLRFAGKGEFLEDHGFDSVLGLRALQPLLEDSSYVGGWGLFDDSLFDLAYQQFDDLAGQSRPFNLTLLTVDTHHPDGQPSASCQPYPTIDNSILHSVHCTDHLVGEFIQRLKRHPAYANTVVVLTSDHLAMRNSAYSLFPESYGRRLYMNVLNTEKKDNLQSYSTAMDIAPTILSLLEVDHEVTFLAGVDLLNSEGQPSLRVVNSEQRTQVIRFINSNFLSSSNILYSLNSSNLESINFASQIQNVEFIDNGLSFEVTGNDPYFYLPALFAEEQKSSELHIDVESEVDTTFTLYFMTEENGTYSEQDTIKRLVRKGSNEIAFDLKDTADGERLRIDPGHLPADYRINSLEIRY